MDRRAFITAVAALGATATFWPGEGLASGQDLVVIVHPRVPVKVLSESDLEAIFLTNRIDWSDGARIVPFNLPPRTPERVDFDDAVLHMTPDQVARYWIDRRIRGGARPPRQVSGAKLLVAVASRLPGAIGYVPRSFVDSSVKVVAQLKNGKVLPP